MKAIEGAGRAGPALIRFQTDGDWLGGARGPPRIGGRIALAAIMPAAGTDVLFVSVHLENHSDPDLRGRQMQGLLDAVDRLRRGCPPSSAAISIAARWRAGCAKTPIQG